MYYETGQEKLAFKDRNEVYRINIDHESIKYIYETNISRTFYPFFTYLAHNEVLMKNKYDDIMRFNETLSDDEILYRRKKNESREKYFQNEKMNNPHLSLSDCYNNSNYLFRFNECKDEEKLKKEGVFYITGKTK